MPVGRDLIVIGGSVGGLSALCRFVVPLAANFPAAIVVAIFNGPGGGASSGADSMQLPAIVAQHTRLSVRDAADGEEFHPGNIYLAPQGHHLVVLPTGRFGFDDAAVVDYPAPSADPLFRSAAAAYGRRVIGIVLSGTGDDGSDGLKAIHREGGICIVQSPSDATARGMPTNALLSNHTDFCVLLDEMPKLLMSLVSPTGRAG
ncbi:two-component system chemotaxis response regulator CheB [Variovorax sp. GrIS 2.14]|jgi:two-component system chemotaxis response regulator CheB|uniref:chemotaxis protein CheB n=1 Tax=Variovorax sp. GrIS 2.14 TaxID=3071709 RepID=UPI0038F6E64B